jgi:hypothetical protein
MGPPGQDADEPDVIVIPGPAGPQGPAGGGGGSVTRAVITAAYPPRREQIVTVTDAAVVNSTYKINAWASGLVESDLNSSDGVDLVALRAIAQAGSFRLEVQTLTPWAGTLSVDYTVTA